MARMGGSQYGRICMLIVPEGISGAVTFFGGKSPFVCFGEGFILV